MFSSSKIMKNHKTISVSESLRELLLNESERIKILQSKDYKFILGIVNEMQEIARQEMASLPIVSTSERYLSLRKIIDAYLVVLRSESLLKANSQQAQRIKDKNKIGINSFWQEKSTSALPIPAVQIDPLNVRPSTHRSSSPIAIFYQPFSHLSSPQQKSFINELRKVEDMRDALSSQLKDDIEGIVSYIGTHSRALGMTEFNVGTLVHKIYECQPSWACRRG